MHQNWKIMKIHIFIRVVLLLLLFHSCNGKAQSEKKNSSFQLGYYRITPSEKLIERMEGVAGENWDGFQFVKDSKINFDSTVLVLINDEVYFKEYLPKEMDISALRLVKDFNDAYLTDGKSIFHYNTGRDDLFRRIDISGMKEVTDFVFQKPAGKLFFLKPYAFELVELDLKNLDLTTLKHISGQYFYDKNGLYFFGGHDGLDGKYTEKSEIIMPSNGKNIVPKINRQYFVYDGAVFGLTGAERIERIKINPEKMIEIGPIEIDNYLLTDGENSYYSSSGYDDFIRNFAIDFSKYFKTPINIQKWYSANSKYLQSGKNPSEVELITFQKESFYQYPPTSFIAMVNGENYIFYPEDTEKAPVKITKLTTYNNKTKALETLDPSQFKQFGNGEITVYKNTAYYDEVELYTDGWDLKNLREIENSDFLTDGRMILDLSNVGGYGIKKINGKEFADLSERVFPDAYSEKIKVIGEEILTDGTYIYTKQQKIKISDWKLKVKIL